jgi:hypothetical protein
MTAGQHVKTFFLLAIPFGVVIAILIATNRPPAWWTELQGQMQGPPEPVGQTEPISGMYANIPPKKAYYPQAPTTQAPDPRAFPAYYRIMGIDPNELIRSLETMQ